MDVEAIRALVDDAPCETSTEMFEMQDLLVCADEWAAKVKKVIDDGADITLDHLKEILDEAKDIPVIMDEQKFLEAEIAAREWCTIAAAKLASRKSIEEIEDLRAQANSIRERIYPKKQSRWKPQIEREIHAAMDQARKWINELRDNLGVTAFDKLFASLSSYVPCSVSSRSLSHSSASHGDRANKKSMDTIGKLVEKSQALAVDVSSYTTPLNDLLLKGVEAQAEASAVLMSIGCLSGTNFPDTADDKERAEIESTPRELGDLAQASSLLERIYAFPFTFDEGQSLASIVEGEKGWAARVRECIPPRQSRKKGLANESFSTEQLHELLNESKRLRFLFRDELRILSKELNDLILWRAKAHEVMNGEICAPIGKEVDRLRSFDLLVYGKLQLAKQKLHIGNAVAVDTGDTNCKLAGTGASLPWPKKEMEAVKDEARSEKANGHTMDVDAEGPSDPGIVLDSKERRLGLEVVNCESGCPKNGINAGVVAGANTASSASIAGMNMRAVEIHIDEIMTRVRIESGCMRKSVSKDEEDDTNAIDVRRSWMAENGQDLLESVLAMTEESFEAVNSLELKEAELRQTVEELVLAGEKGDIVEDITDKSVRVLNAWKQQLVHVRKESDILSVEAPEQQALGLVISLLDWLQGSRSLFYDEILPLQDLVEKGDRIAEDLRKSASHGFIGLKTLEIMELMLWPLPYLKAHEKVVLEWTARVHKCVAGKHAQVNELQVLLDSGSGLLLEQGAFKIVMDEAKKAKIWLLKLKKRLRALTTKGAQRLSMGAARSLVEEGEDIAIDIPVFDFLKEHLEIATDWEQRVLGSGIETGQARVATLLALLNEYECARLVIDLDMHRDVLKSATEQFCICRQPFDGLMIGCDYCDDWFHDSCIGMSKEKAEKVEHYTCPSCTVLQELAATLQQATITLQQGTLWDMHEYAKAFEKHQASALRKVKREEKTVERTEMLLFSVTNQMHQLRARIDDTERAKACLTIKGNGTFAAHYPSKQTSQLGQSAAERVSAASASAVAMANAVTSKAIARVTVPTISANTNASLLAAASSSAATTASSKSNTALSAASAIAGINATVLNRQQYPSILIPPMRAVGKELKSVSNPEDVGKLVAKIDAGSSAKAPTINGTTVPKECLDVAKTNTSPALPVTFSSSFPASSCQQTTSAMATPVAPPTSIPSTPAPGTAQQTLTPALLNPITATLMGSALVVAGGVEQQLAKMKREHVEASKQVLELQTSLRLSRERLTKAQQALREISDIFHARHRMLSYAQTWAQQAGVLLNTTALLSRANVVFEKFIPQEYESALDAMVCSPLDPAAGSTTESVPMKIDKLFPGVDSFARLLRAVPWSLVVVSLLQQRPSRDEISNAISYASEYGLWEDKKISTALRSLIGRVDAWVSRAHKCIVKTGTKMQQLPRLKVLMNEYTKLPLTYSKAAGPLDIYVEMLSGVGVKSDVKSESSAFTLAAAETAAITALDDAMVGISSSLAASGVGTMGSSSTQKQAPRKRRMYTRKEKSASCSLKKVKTSRDGSDDACVAQSSTNSATLVEVSDKASMTKAS
uniref:PHD-type domain-containing protein n=1 Tax=Hyaloperonospora arabidopsidis (strain Emoy2) TaxID=559515 RepID=M4BA76_HYAAE